MAIHNFEHKGHKIVIALNCDVAGYWGWSYKIDSGTPTPSTAQIANDAVEAIVDAIRHARRQIDHSNM